MFTLTRLSGPRQHEQLHLESPLTRLGRAKENEVPFDKQAERVVSSRHAEIRLEQGVYMLYDLQSTHGTYLHGQRVTRAQLHEGDVIGLGQNLGGPTLSFSRRSSTTQARRPPADDYEATAFNTAPAPAAPQVPESTIPIQRAPAAAPGFYQGPTLPSQRAPHIYPTGLLDVKAPPPSGDPTGLIAAGVELALPPPDYPGLAPTPPRPASPTAFPAAFPAASLEPPAPAAAAHPPAAQAWPSAQTSSSGLLELSLSDAYEKTHAHRPHTHAARSPLEEAPASAPHRPVEPTEAVRGNAADPFAEFGHPNSVPGWTEASQKSVPAIARSATPQPGALLEEVAMPSPLTQQVRALRFQLTQLGNTLLEQLRQKLRQRRSPSNRTASPLPPAPFSTPPSTASSEVLERPAIGSQLARMTHVEVDAFGNRKAFVLEEALKENSSNGRWGLPRFVLTFLLIFGLPVLMWRWGEPVMLFLFPPPPELTPTIQARPADAPLFDPPGTRNPELVRHMRELVERRRLLPPLQSARGEKVMQFLRPVLHDLGEDTTMVPEILANEVRGEIEQLRRRRDYLVSFKRMRKHRPGVVMALEQLGLPESLSYLPWALSLYSPEYREPQADRFGLWALSSEVAERHGLRVEKKADDRLEIRRATDAAISHLAELVGEVRGQSFTLAVAAWPNGVYGARKLLTYETAWELTQVNLFYFMREKYLDRADRAFLVKVLAGAVIDLAPEQFDLPLDEE